VEGRRSLSRPGQAAAVLSRGLAAQHLTVKCALKGLVALTLFPLRRNREMNMAIVELNLGMGLALPNRPT
jgi:hypothetical protein